MDDPKNWSPLRRRFEAFKKIKELITGPHEIIPEALVRDAIAEQLGIKPEEVTWQQIRFEVAGLLPYYPAITVVPSEPIPESLAQSTQTTDATAKVDEPASTHGPVASSNGRLELEAESIDRPATARANAAEWETFTPTSLQPAVRAIHESFDQVSWKCAESTRNLCYAALHPVSGKPSSNSSKQLDPYRNFVGALIGRDFQELLVTPPDSPSAVFKAYLDAYENALKEVMRQPFQDLVEIAIAQAGILNIDPIEWAESHLQILISGEKHSVRRWIKDVCDQQDKLELETSEDFEELAFWRTWRAPRFIRMKPSGNTPYNPASAWTREEQAMSEKLLEGLAERFITFLNIELSKIVGRAHVRLSKQNNLAPQCAKEEVRGQTPASALSEKREGAPAAPGARPPGADQAIANEQHPPLPPQKCDYSGLMDSARLTELQRECYSLRHEYQLPVAEIARRLGRDRKTIQEHIDAADKKVTLAANKERSQKRRARFGVE
jgi:hypothetical protein